MPVHVCSLLYGVILFVLWLFPPEDRLLAILLRLLLTLSSSSHRKGDLPPPFSTLLFAGQSDVASICFALPNLVLEDQQPIWFNFVISHGGLLLLLIVLTALVTIFPTCTLFLPLSSSPAFCFLKIAQEKSPLHGHHLSYQPQQSSAVIHINSNVSTIIWSISLTKDFVATPVNNLSGSHTTTSTNLLLLVCFLWSLVFLAASSMPFFQMAKNISGSLYSFWQSRLSWR